MGTHIESLSLGSLHRCDAAVSEVIFLARKSMPSA